MKKLLLFLVLINVFPAGAQNIPARPDPPKLVNDFTETLTASEQAALERKLVDYNDSTSTQIAIVILGTLDGYPIEDFAFALGDKWGIGQKDKDNGVVILVALNDHKIFIATGYGVEGVFPDGLVKRIVENDIKPSFKAGNYYAGLDAAINSMFRLAAGEYTAEESNGEKPAPGIIFAIIALFFILMIFLKVRSVKKYAAINSIPYWTAWTLLNQARRVHPGSWGGFSGGSSWGGGGGGGGFGGFGGGSFGGGGAGGSW